MADSSVKSIKKPVSFEKFLWQIGVFSAEQLSKIQQSSDEGRKTLLRQYLSEHDEIFYRNKWQNFPQLSMKSIDNAQVIPLSLQFAQKRKFIAIEIDSKTLGLLMSNPLDVEGIQSILESSAKFGKKIEIKLADEEEIQWAIKTYLQPQDTANKSSWMDMQISQNQEVSQAKGKGVESQNAAFKIIQVILEKAMELGSSDIHIEANNHGIRVLMRIRKVLEKAFEFNKSMRSFLRQKLIMMGGGDITQIYMIQDLGFEIDESTSVRMSYLPTVTGYSIVLRLIQQSHLSGLESITNLNYVIDNIVKVLKSEQGMLLVTGPTSSGKSTFLYTILNYLRVNNRKIITMEDPVEAKLDGIMQVHVKPEAGLDYPDVIKACLRQNPDIIMLGEVRDAETAVPLARVAMTGIMVLATLHTQNVIHTITRLVDLGVDPFLIGAGLQLVIATRLLSRNCEHCLEAYCLDAEQAAWLSSIKQNKDWTKIPFYQGKGCANCKGSGLKGVASLQEILALNKEMKELLYNNKLPAFYQMAEESIKNKSLLDHAINYAVDGTIAFEQLYKMASDY